MPSDADPVELVEVMLSKVNRSGWLRFVLDCIWQVRPMMALQLIFVPPRGPAGHFSIPHLLLVERDGEAIKCMTRPMSRLELEFLLDFGGVGFRPKGNAV